MKLLFVDFTKGFSPRRLASKPTGGIITSMTLIPQFLAGQGHDVKVISNHATEETINGVKYAWAYDRSEKFDAVVFNRNSFDHATLDAFGDAVKIWWLHDIVDPSYCRDSSFGRMDKIVALSTYNRDSYSDFYGLPLEKFTIIPNGVDKSIFFPAHAAKDRNLFVYASAPIKGMYPLEYTFWNLSRLNPLHEMRVYSSQKLHDLEDSPAMSAQLQALSKAGVRVLDPIPQHELAEVLRRAWCFLMPNHYPESMSNLAEQAKACGTPIVASPIGSLSEQVQHGVNGLLTKAQPHDMFLWWKQFAEACAELYLDRELHYRLSSNAPNGVLSWDDVGSKWASFITQAVEERSAVA